MMKLIQISIIVSLLFTSNVNSQLFFQSESFWNEKELLTVTMPDSIFIGMGIASVITEDGDFFYADNSSSTIMHFNINATFVKSFGRSGLGPGDIGDISDMQIVGDFIYLLDYSNGVIQIFDPFKGVYINSIIMKDRLSILSRFRIDENNNSITVFGFKDDNRKLVHKYDIDGDYIESQGEYIDFDKFMNNYSSRTQLSQMHYAENRDKIILTLGAPYRQYCYEKNSGKLIWEFEDSIIPKPWIDHIIIRPDYYQSKAYPNTYYSFIDDKFIHVYWIDADNLKSYIDSRSLTSGELVNRSEINFEMAPITFKTNTKGELTVITKSRENDNLYKIILNRNQ